jgi:inosine/xanthosine triphosphate pyrophosphatase family protein
MALPLSLYVQLPPEVKNQLSHRGQALAGLLSHFRARH